MATKLGDYIREERERRKLTLRQLSDRSGIAYSAIHKIETGATNDVAVSTLEKLANGLMLPFERLALVARGLDPDKAPDSITDKQSADIADIATHLPPERQEELREIAEMMLRRLKEQGK